MKLQGSAMSLLLRDACSYAEVTRVATTNRTNYNKVEGGRVSDKGMDSLVDRQ